MTRSRGILYTLLAVTTVGLALATGAHFIGSARAAVGPLPPEGLALPADSQLVMGLDMRRVVASPFYTKYLAKNEHAFNDLEHHTGINPTRDVDQIIVGGAGSRDGGAVIVFGRFDRTRVQQSIESHQKGKATWKNQGGTTIYLFNEGARKPAALAFLADNVLVMGTQSDVETITANHTGGKRTLAANTKLMALVESVKPGSTFWAVSEGDVLSRLKGRASTLSSEAPRIRPISTDQETQIAPPGSPAPPLPLAGMPPLKSVVITGDLEPVVSFQATGETADEAGAKTLADLLRGFIALAQVGAAQRPELKDLPSAFSVTQDAQRVLVSGRFSYELLDALHAAQTRRLPSPAPSPTPTGE